MDTGLIWGLDIGGTKCAFVVGTLDEPASWQMEKRPRIVIGSVFARAEPWFRQPMEKVIAKEALSLSAGVCQVVPAALGDRIGDIAALSVAVLGLRDRRKVKEWHR